MSWWVLFSRSCCMIHEAILLCRAVNPADLEVLKMFNACFNNTWKKEKGNSFSVCVIFLTLNIHYSISPRDDYFSFCPIRLCIEKKCTESTCDAVTPVLKVEASLKEKANFSLEITLESSTYVQSSILSCDEVMRWWGSAATFFLTPRWHKHPVSQWHGRISVHWST